MSIIVNQISWPNFDYKHERGPGAISFSFQGKPNSRILLLSDLHYERSFNYHIEGGEDLFDEELDELVRYIICFLQPGHNLLTCSESTEQLWRLYWKFYCYSGKLRDTGCVRVLYDRDGQEKIYKTLKKHDNSTTNLRNCQESIFH